MQSVTRRLILSSLALGTFGVLALGSAGDPTPGPTVKVVAPPHQMTVGQPVTITLEVKNDNDREIALENVSLPDEFADRMELVRMDPPRIAVEPASFGRGEEWVFDPVPLAPKAAKTITLEVIPRVGMDGEKFDLAVDSRIDGKVGSDADSFHVQIAGEPTELLSVQVKAPEVVTDDRGGVATVRITNNGVRPRMVNKFKFTKGYGKKTYVYADFQTDKDKMKRSEAFVFTTDRILPPQKTAVFEFDVEYYEKGTAKGHVEITYDGSLFHDHRVPIRTSIE